MHTGADSNSCYWGGAATSAAIGPMLGLLTKGGLSYQQMAASSAIGIVLWTVIYLSIVVPVSKVATSHFMAGGEEGKGFLFVIAGLLTVSAVGVVGCGAGLGLWHQCVAWGLCHD